MSTEDCSCGSLLRDRLLVAGLVLLGACAPEARSEAIVPPNIILIVADDQGYGVLGSYGQALIQTPRLDRMASEGMRFTNHYAGSTVCAPSRCVLMTGLHSGHCRVCGNALVPLGFGRVKLCYAAPRDSHLLPEGFDGLRIATSFMRLVARDLKRRGIKATLVRLDGAVEIAI